MRYINCWYLLRGTKIITFPFLDLVEDDKHGKSRRDDKRHTTACIVEKIAMVLNLPRKESARKPPSKQRRKDVPMKSVTTLAEVELG